MNNQHNKINPTKFKKCLSSKVEILCKCFASPLNTIFRYYLEVFPYALCPCGASRWFLFLRISRFQEFIPRLRSLLNHNLPSLISLCLFKKKNGMPLESLFFLTLFKSLAFRRKTPYETLSASYLTPSLIPGGKRVSSECFLGLVSPENDKF